MASRQDFRMEGFQALERALKALGPEVATKAGAEGLRKATNVMRNAVKAKAPKGDQPTKRTWRNKDGSQGSADYGRLRDNIKTRKRVNRRPKRTPYRRPKGTPFVERCEGYGGRAVRAGCGVGRA